VIFLSSLELEYRGRGGFDGGGRGAVIIRAGWLGQVAVCNVCETEGVLGLACAVVIVQLGSAGYLSVRR
jgi:hypothetical protein